MPPWTSELTGIVARCVYICPCVTGQLPTIVLHASTNSGGSVTEI